MKLPNSIRKELAPGLTGYYTHGEQLTFGLVEIEAGANMPVHQHLQEQITYILEGELQMVIGGEKLLLSRGMIHVIPSQMSHGAVAITHCKVIDVFNPPREDYKQ